MSPNEMIMIGLLFAYLGPQVQLRAMARDQLIVNQVAGVALYLAGGVLFLLGIGGAS